MNENTDTQHLAAEYIRKAYKHMQWAAKNLANYYKLIRPMDMPPLEDPNQLLLFQDDEDLT